MSQDPRNRRAIGVLGGSFSPIHHAHLWVAHYLLEELMLSEVVFVPAGQHAFKGRLLEAHHRLEMIRLAIQGKDRFRLSTIEVDRPGPSYTYETLQRLQEEVPDATLYFIIGGDNLAEVPMWHRGEELLRKFTFVVVGRNQADRTTLESIMAQDPLLRKYRANVMIVQMPFAFDLSSSFIRERLAAGKSIAYLVPEPVEAYIREHRLYTGETC